MLFPATRQPIKKLKDLVVGQPEYEQLLSYADLTPPGDVNAGGGGDVNPAPDLMSMGDKEKLRTLLSQFTLDLKTATDNKVSFAPNIADAYLDGIKKIVVMKI